MTALTGDHIPTLDGWRGIAILLVLVDHFTPWAGSDAPYAWLRTGQHGVTIFFVLSGFLITTKLTQGPIDLRRFYVRRFFRLMPVAWCYLAFLAVVHSITRIEAVSSLLFFRNYVLLPMERTAHFWSLSIEEQFYLVWPALLLLFGRRVRWMAVALVAAFATYRLLVWPQAAGLGFPFTGRTEFHADALLVGCLAALWRPAKLPFWPLLAVLGCFLYSFHALIPLAESLAIAGVLLAGIDARIRWLEWEPLAWLGRISYSVYVWQQAFTVSISHHANRLWYLLLFPPVVLASYYLIERPCNRLGHHKPERLRAGNPLKAGELGLAGSGPGRDG